MQALSSMLQIKSLFKREVKGYFSSSVYVSNTIVTNILSIAFAVTVLIFGVQTLDNLLGGVGMVEAGAPFLIALMVSMYPTTISSISIEGKKVVAFTDAFGANEENFPCKSISAFRSCSSICSNFCIVIIHRSAA